MTISIEEARKSAGLSVFHVGASCYLDTFAGMVPCVVTAIAPGRWHGFSVGGKRSITIRLTKTVGAYQKGEVIEEHSGDVVPKSHRVLRDYHYRINTSYCFDGADNA